MANISKEKILNRIRLGLKDRTPIPEKGLDPNTEIYLRDEDEDLALTFAENFTAINGNFIFCESLEIMVEQLIALTEEKNWRNLHCWHNDLIDVFKTLEFKNIRIGKMLDKADAGITICEALIARTGSILLSSNLPSGRVLSIFPEVHICIAFANQLHFDIKDGIEFLQKKYKEDLPSFITFASGPSRTADIEKTLVLGAHGPKEVFVFLIDEDF